MKFAASLRAHRRGYGIACAAVIASMLVVWSEFPGSARYNGVGRLGPFAWTEHLDVTYATPANGSGLDTVNICQPAPVGSQWPGPFPAILLIHGGGWNGGDNAIGTHYTGYSSAWCQIFASWGFVAYSLGYRLQNGTPGNAWPAQLVDAQAAVRWVRDRAANANPDRVRPDLIGAMGDSAGGSLAMQLGTLSSNVPNPGDPVADTHAHVSPRVQFVISAFGPFTWGPASPDAPLPRQAIDQAGPSAPLAPTLFIQGTRDHIVRPDQSIAAYCVLKSHGIAAHYLSYDGDHEFSGFPGPDWTTVVGNLITGAISFAVDLAHRVPPQSIPATVSGPNMPFDDAVLPQCNN